MFLVLIAASAVFAEATVTEEELGPVHKPRMNSVTTDREQNKLFAVRDSKRMRVTQSNSEPAEGVEE